MFVRTALLLVLFGGLVCASACGSIDRDGDSAGAGDKGGDDSAEPLQAAAYADTTEGLRAFFKDLTQALESGHRMRARIMARSLELRASEAWFTETFGTPLGNTLHGDYKPMLGSFGTFADMVDTLREQGQTRFLVERFDSADDQAAVGFQALALGRMVKPTALYSVRAVNEQGDKVFHLWSFVYQDGFFRWVGKMREVVDPDDPDDKPKDGKTKDSKPKDGKTDPADNKPDIREYRQRDADAAREALK